MKGVDRELGMNRPINRRQFLDGIAVGSGVIALGSVVGCGSDSGSTSTSISGGNAAYPPTVQGMRGNTDISRMVLHSLRDGIFSEDIGNADDTGEKYDLVVVGGGLSGLSAARFYQQEFGQNARILILDAMDDCGGHARRNAFEARGRTRVGDGGVQSLEAASTFNRPANGSLE